MFAIIAILFMMGLIGGTSNFLMCMERRCIRKYNIIFGFMFFNGTILMLIIWFITYVVNFFIKRFNEIFYQW